MPTPTEAAQFHIFSIKRMKYMPKKKSESKIETFLKSFCSAKESFRSSESIGLRIIIMNVDMQLVQHFVELREQKVESDKISKS